MQFKDKQLFQKLLFSTNFIEAVNIKEKEKKEYKEEEKI